MKKDISNFLNKVSNFLCEPGQVCLFEAAPFLLFGIEVHLYGVVFSAIAGTGGNGYPVFAQGAVCLSECAVYLFIVELDNAQLHGCFELHV